MVADTDVVRFKVAFNRLAVETRLPADQADMATQRIYFEGLSEWPIEAVEDAAREIGKKAEWFPKLKEWRDAVKVVRRDAINRQPKPRLQLVGDVASLPSVPVQDLRDAMDDYLAMRAAGVSREDACKGLEGLLRVLLPVQRSWAYDCEDCLDTGFRPFLDERGRRWTERCVCWNTNPTLRRYRERTFGAQA
jgi:hypothetical protein